MEKRKPRKPKVSARNLSLGRFQNIVRRFAGSALLRIFMVFLVVVVLFGFIVSSLEAGPTNSMYKNFFDGIWWALVTITTVGYGDKFPQTVQGRLFAMLLMVSGLGLTTIISGTIASIFVERRIREGKGLQMIKAKNHILLCGWNRNAKMVIEGLAHKQEGIAIVLVNTMDSNTFEALQSVYRTVDLRFIKGDFTQEQTLTMASIKTARSCIIILDDNNETGSSNSDEKTILACLAVRSIAPELHICASITKAESRQHLVRAHVDDIILQDEISSHLLTASGFNTGVSEAVLSLLDYRSQHAMQEIDFPRELVGKTFLDASQWFLKNRHAVLVGVLSKEKPVTLDDLLSDDTSAIDAFIKRKFEEAKIIVDDSGIQNKVKLSPDPSYVISEADIAFVIGGNA